jgi:hypothetical protein
MLLTKRLGAIAPTGILHLAAKEAIMRIRLVTTSPSTVARDRLK